MTNDYEVDENGRVTIVKSSNIILFIETIKFSWLIASSSSLKASFILFIKSSLLKLNFIVSMNKIIFDDLTIEAAAKDLGMSENELDQKILATLMRNESKLNRYLDKKSGNTDKQNNRKNQGKIQKNKYNRESNNRRNKTISRSKEG